MIDKLYPRLEHLHDHIASNQKLMPEYKKDAMLFLDNAIKSASQNDLSEFHKDMRAAIDFTEAYLSEVKQLSNFLTARNPENVGLRVKINHEYYNLEDILERLSVIDHEATNLTSTIGREKLDPAEFVSALKELSAKIEKAPVNEDMREQLMIRLAFSISSMNAGDYKRAATNISGAISDCNYHIAQLNGADKDNAVAIKENLTMLKTQLDNPTSKYETAFRQQGASAHGHGR